MFRYIIFIAFSIFLFISCIDKSDTTDKSKIKREVTHSDTITFKLNDNISQTWRMTQYVSTDTADLLFVQDFVNDRDLFCFQINNGIGTIAKTIHTEKEGPNGVGNLQGFYFIDWDSIITVDSYGYAMNLINQDGKLIDKYSLIKEDIGPSTYLPKVGYGTVIFKFGNQIIIPCTSDASPYQMNYVNNSFQVVYDLESRDFKYSGVTFPDRYRGNYFGIENSDATYTYNDREEVIYNFPVVNNLIVKNGNEEVSVNANSRYIDDKIPPMAAYSEVFYEYTSYKLGIDRYISIDYDSYRNVYYRFFEQKYPEDVIPKLLNGTADHSDDIGKRGLVMLDEDFNVIYDYAFPKGLSTKARFLIKSGLYLKIFTEEENEYEVKYTSVNFTN